MRENMVVLVCALAGAFFLGKYAGDIIGDLIMWVKGED